MKQALSEVEAGCRARDEACNNSKSVCCKLFGHVITSFVNISFATENSRLLPSCGLPIRNTRTTNGAVLWFQILTEPPTVNVAIEENIMVVE